MCEVMYVAIATSVPQPLRGSGECVHTFFRVVLKNQSKQKRLVNSEGHVCNDDIGIDVFDVVADHGRDTCGS